MKLSIVLPGGGACGRWQIGVLKYLYDMGVFPKINLVCGTSVGGLNTLLIGKYWLDFQKACDMWARIKTNKDIFNGMLQFGGPFDLMGMIGQTFFTNKGRSILDPVGLYHTIDKEFGNMALIDLKVPVMITTTNMTTGERNVYSSTLNPYFKCSELAKATSAIPAAFPAVELANKELHSDGGVLRNNPVCYAIDAQSTHVILIGTSPDAYPAKPIKNNILEIALRLQDVVMHSRITRRE
jgi:predicted acylesterase/phospholipase RssA